MRRSWSLGPVVVTLACVAACAQPAPPGTVRPQPSAADGASSTPTAEAADGCPAPGVLITAERGDAAMGYREMTIHMTNCGDQPYTVQGRPDVVVLGRDRAAVDVAVVPSVHYPAPPRQATLQPGTSVMAVLSWRNTVTDSTVVATSGVYLSIAPLQGAPRQTVTPPNPLDLGNTGRLEASNWL